MTTTIIERRIGRLRVALEWKLADLWVGAYYAKSEDQLDVWVCVLPCLPIHVTLTSDDATYGPHVCPGCYAVGHEPCAPGCIDAEIEEQRRLCSSCGHSESYCYCEREDDGL